MEFRILGPLEVRSEQGPLSLGRVKPRAVLAVLLLHANEPVSAERLAQALWGEDAPADATKTVQVHVSRLRKALGEADVVASTPAGYCLRVRTGELDAEVFERLAGEGRAALAAGEWEQAASRLREALSLWRGPPLADLQFEPFARAEIARLDELRMAALEARMEADLACGRHADLVAELQSEVGEHPSRERLAGQLMLALYRSGRQADALATYRDARRRLVDAVGVEPGAELQRLHEAILRQDALLDLAPATRELPPALERAARLPLFGRTGELARLHELWSGVQREGVGALVITAGEPGMGKTRLAAQFAGDVLADRGEVLYAGGRSPIAGDVVARAARAVHPTLLVADDLDHADPHVCRAVAEIALSFVPLFVLVTGAKGTALDRLHPAVALRLGPLEADDVRRIAALYAGEDGSESLDLAEVLAITGGAPARVHEFVSQWTRRQAAQRVEDATTRVDAGRREWLGAESQLAHDVVELQSVRERADVLRETDADDATVPCPFKGLATFEFDDARYFFGRERAVAELVARMVGAPLLCILGASGSGKSSLLRAGLLSAIADGVLPGSERWARVLIRPGEHPLRELRRAMSSVDHGRRMLLAVDQFEETFTACRDEEERRAFIDALVGAGLSHAEERRVIVVAMRADFYARCAAYPNLPELLAANHVLVGRMRRDDLRRVIERPAERAGLRIDPQLVDVLLDDVEREPGGLPLLSTSLLELWRRRDGRALRLSTYNETGGVSTAIARLAEDAFARLQPEQHAVVRRVLLRLAAEGPDAAVVRRRVRLVEVLEEHGRDDVARVVSLLAERRLVTVSADTVEVAHEALLREWPRLREWLEDDADGRRIHRHLTHATHDWTEGARNPSDLYRGARLAAALDWRGEHDEELNDAERAFLDASHAADRDELEAAHRRTRRLRTLAVILTGLLLIAGVSTVLAVRQTRRADSQRNIATSRSLAIQAVSQLDRSVVVAALLSLEGYRVKPTVEARNALLTVLPRLDRAEAVLVSPGTFLASVAFSPDGTTLAAAGDDDTVRLWNVHARRPIGSPFVGHNGDVHSVTFSPDGRTLASAGADKTVRLWDVATRRALGPPLRGHHDWVIAVAFSPDGRTLASAGADKTVQLWDFATRRPLGPPLSGHAKGVYGVSFSADGGKLASAGADETVRLWDVAGRRQIGPPIDARAPLSAVAFSSSGKTLASAGADKTVRLWDVATRRAVRQPLRHGDQVGAVVFSADGRTLASASADKAVRLWDVATGKALGPPLRGHTDPVIGLAFSPDGRILASAGGNAVWLWDVAGRRRALARGFAYQGRSRYSATALSPDGQTLAVAGADQAIRLWDVASGRRLLKPLEIRQHSGPLALALDHRKLAFAAPNGTLRLWDVVRRRALGPPLTGHTGFVSALAFSRDSRTLVSGGGDRTVRLWDIARREALGPPIAVDSRFTSVVISPDGKTLAFAGEDGAVRLWDVDRGRALGSPLIGRGSSQVSATAFSRDGRVLASAEATGLVRLWDVGRRRALGSPLTGHSNIVLAMAFSPDGTTLATASYDRTVRLWDLAQRRPLGQPLRHTAAVDRVAFRADGKGLVSVGDDATVRIWDPILWSASLPVFNHRICSVIGGGLSRAEWQEFLPDRPYHETCPHS
jgi:WD40 repeat protein/DNA-binding SARP family transcriptional activator